MAPLAQTPLPAVAAPSAASSRETAGTKGRRIVGIDALRGLVMALMIVEHVREYFYLHAQVSGPVVIATTPPSLFTRLAAHLCAPVFVILTGAKRPPASCSSAASTCHAPRCSPSRCS